MADLQSLTVGEVLGGLALIGVVLRFLWDLGDRFARKVAAVILSSDDVRSAVGAVAVSVVRKSGEFVWRELYEEQRRSRDLQLDELNEKMEKLSAYVMSDQLPRKIVEAMHGAPTRRENTR